MTRTDLTGKVFGRWTAIRFSHVSRGHYYWICRCACGLEYPVDGGNLRSGHSTNCGCLTGRKSYVHFQKRFWSKFWKTDNCWLWTGKVSNKGYGLVSHLHTYWNVHRMSWTLTNGPIPNGLIVMHKCDNPICGNPEHLVLGTYQDNTRDMVAKGRWKGSHPKREDHADRLIRCHLADSPAG